MADNVELNAGSGGSTIKTDDDGTAHWQYVKVAFGADNTQTRVTSSTGLPVSEVNLHTADFDSGTGTSTIGAVGLAVPASGGPVIIPGDATAGLKVDLGADNDVTVTGSVTANAGTNLNTSALALESGGNLATLAGAVSGSEVQVDVVGSLPAGTNAIGKLAANSGVDIGDVDITSIAAQTSGGASVHYTNDLDESEEAVKASAGTFYGGIVLNLASSVRYLQVFNAGTGSVTVGSTTPMFQIPIPTQGDTNGAGFVIPVPVCGIEMDTAITVAASTDSEGNTAPGTNEVHAVLWFK